MIVDGLFNDFAHFVGIPLSCCCYECDLTNERKEERKRHWVEKQTTLLMLARGCVLTQSEPGKGGSKTNKEDNRKDWTRLRKITRGALLVWLGLDATFSGGREGARCTRRQRRR